MAAAVSEAKAQNELTTTGTDFWFGFMDNYLDADPVYTVFITSEQATSGTLEIPLLGWSENFTTSVGNTSAINIPLTATNNVSGVVASKGVHLTSASPVSAYVMNYIANSADATRISPKPFLDTDYIVVGYEGLTNITDTLRSELLIVATEDDTELVITPSCDMLGGALQNTPFTIQLNQGETYFLQATELQDITGTTVAGTEESGDCRPFAVFGGSQCPGVGDQCTPCDHVFDQMIPSSVWGTEYLLGTFDTWISSYTYKVTAAENGTQVFEDGVLVFTLNAGQTEEVNSIADPVFITSSAPVGVIQYMEGGGCTISGDPSMMTVNSLSQTMSQVTFTTIESDIITEHHLQITVPSSATELVFLDGAQVPSTEFTAYPGNTQFSFADIAIPEGSHTLQCDLRFIANVYGLGNAESYFYSTGASASEPVEPISTVFCTENQVVLETAENFTNISWATLEDPDTEIFVGQPFIILPPIQNQAYILTGNNFLSGCPEEELYSVESPAPLNVAITESTIDLCLFEEYTFNSTVTPAGSQYQYSWSDASSFVQPNQETGTIAPTESGLYYLDVSSFSGCASGRDSVQVNVVNEDITLIQASANPELICEGQTVNLEMNAGQNAGIDLFNSMTLNPTLWSAAEGSELGELCNEGPALIFNGAPERTLESVDFGFTDGGVVSFSLFISDGTNGCDAAETGENILFEYSTNGGATWTPLETYLENLFPEFTSIEVVLPPEAASPNTRFRWSQPNFSAADEDIWMLDNVVFSPYGPPSGTVNWSSSDVITDNLAPITTSQPVENSWYTVELTSNGCTYTDSVLVEVQPAFDLVITADTTICSPLPTALEVTPSEPGFYFYEWDNEMVLNTSNTANPIATPIENTTFTVEVTNAAGCSNTAIVTVDLEDEVAPFIFTENQSVCEVPVPLEVIVEDDPSNYTFQWTLDPILDDLTGQTVNASPAGGTFTTLEVLVTNNVTGCVNMATQNLSANFAEFNLPADTVICESEGFIIEYEVINSMFNAIQWNSPDVLDNAFTEFPTITEPDFNGDLIVNMFVPGANGCSVVDTITIITQPLDFSAPDVLSICPGETLQTAITGDFSGISWAPSPNLDASNPESPIFSNTETETFFFNLSGGGGCALSESIDIVANLPLDFEITPPVMACEGNDIFLDNPLSGFTYEWNTTETTEDIMVSAAGNYSVIVTDSAGCAVSDDIEILTSPAPTFEITGAADVCEGETITLTADITGVTYEWSNNSALQTADFSLLGDQIIWAEVTDADGCLFRDSVEVSFVPLPELTLSSSGNICDDASATLTAVSSEPMLIWETNETTSEITVTAPGFYSVTASNVLGCEITDSIEVTLIVLPEVNLVDTFFCEGSSVSIQPVLPENFSVLWSTNESTNTISVNEAGVYELTLSSNGCGASFSFTVVQEPLPSLEIFTPGEFCIQDLGEEGFELSAESDGAVQWLESFQTGNTFSITQSGVYTATAASLSGCLAEETIVILDSCDEPIVYIPNAFTPDGDGNNEVWKPVFFGAVSDYKLVIFDRDGHLVLETTDPLSFWDGSVNGGDYYAQDGIYHYLLSFSNGPGTASAETREIYGHITVLR